MAQELVRIYLKGGAVIEFVADGFSVDRSNPPAGAKLGMLNMGQTDLHLAFIDLAEIAAVSKEPVRPSNRPD